MIGIKISKHNSIDRALKILREKIKNAKIMENYKEKQYFIKPSEKKNIKKRTQKRNRKFTK